MRFLSRVAAVATRLWLALALLGLAGLAAARGVNTVSLEDSRALSFPQATAFVPVAPAAVAAAQRELSKDFEMNMLAAHFVVLKAMKGTDTLGWFVTDQVIGKFEKIDYAVALDPAGAVTRVDILAYREKHGHEVAERGWLDQFIGKTAASPLKLDKDVDGVSGATMSCMHVSEGVRRVTRLVALLNRTPGAAAR